MVKKGEILFGPAGLGPVKDAEKNLEKYHKLGLRACEVAFTYGVYIKKDEDLERIGKKAKDLGIQLSIHAPYFINLNSAEKEKIEASKKRILACCEAGEKMGAKHVVFHPGFYGKDREGAGKVIIENLKDIMETVKKNKWKIKVCPETMGKVNVFGSIDEIGSLVKETGCSVCIDYAHILARDKAIDYEKIEKTFKKIPEWHLHFSGIVYGEKGEKHHIKTEKKAWKELLEKLPKDRKIVIINESPDMVADSVDGLAIWEKMK